MLVARSRRSRIDVSWMTRATRVVLVSGLVPAASSRSSPGGFCESGERLAMAQPGGPGQLSVVGAEVVVVNVQASRGGGDGSKGVVGPHLLIERDLVQGAGPGVRFDGAWRDAVLDPGDQRGEEVCEVHADAMRCVQAVVCAEDHVEAGEGLAGAEAAAGALDGRVVVQGRPGRDGLVCPAVVEDPAAG